MKTNNELKNLVKEKYAAIANQTGQSGCCGGDNNTNCCAGVDYSIFSESYTHLQGYQPDADMQLGCGLPTEDARLKPGHTVLDLGSGAGNDCFVARALVGDNGKVIGIDMVQEMVDKARNNANKLGYDNVEFRLGDIENMPVEANAADVVISNCVLNLVPDKSTAFNEIMRVLKPGGHLSVSDVVLKGELPSGLSEVAELYAGCVSGAVDLGTYLDIMSAAGLKNIQIQKEKQVILPDELLLEYIDDKELQDFKDSGSGIFSITVYAEKPAL